MKMVPVAVPAVAPGRSVSSNSCYWVVLSGLPVVVTEPLVEEFQQDRDAFLAIVCANKASLLAAFPKAHGSPVAVALVGSRTTKIEAPALKFAKPEGMLKF